MSRVKVSPVEWLDEGPRTPYVPKVRLSGSFVIGGPAVGPAPALPPGRRPDMEEQRRKWNGRIR